MFRNERVREAARMNFDPFAVIGMIGVAILVGAYFASQKGVLDVNATIANVATVRIA